METQPAQNGAFAVALPVFEGPLDLLLSLIQEHKLDIFDIPISFVTDRYLQYMNAAQALNIDLASESLDGGDARASSRACCCRASSRRTLGRAGPDPRRSWSGGCSSTKYKDAAQTLRVPGRSSARRLRAQGQEELPLGPAEVAYIKSPKHRSTG
jgi:hypothetical protein